MSPEEDRSCDYLGERIREFIALNKYELAFRRFLVGHEGVPAHITAVAAIFPRADCDAMDFIMIGWENEPADAIKNYQKVLNVPPISECERTDPQVERDMEHWAAQSNWPLAVLGLGQTQEGKEPVAVLWYVPGTNPQTLLAKLQDYTKSQQHHLN